MENVHNPSESDEKDEREEEEDGGGGGRGAIKRKRRGSDAMWKKNTHTKKNLKKKVGEPVGR